MATTYDHTLLNSRAQNFIPHAPSLGYYRCHYIAETSNIRCSKKSGYLKSKQEDPFLLNTRKIYFCDEHKHVYDDQTC